MTKTREKKPQVIEHEPADPTPRGVEPEEPPAPEGGWWDWKALGLTILPHTPYEEWENLWNQTRRTHQSVNWWIGDVLNFAQDTYPETWTQVLGAHGIEVYKNAMWVAKVYPLVDRVEDVSWSNHREVAKYEPAVRAEWLKKCVEQDWTLKQLTEALALDKQQKALAERRNAPPEEQIERPGPRTGAGGAPEPQPEPATTMQAPVAEKPTCPQCNSDDLSEEDNDGQPYLVCGNCGWDNLPEPEPAIATAPPPRAGDPEPLPPPRSRADTMRAALEIVRKVGPTAAMGQDVPANAQTEWASCARQLADLPLILSQLRVEKALSWIPGEWLVHHMEAGSETFGGRKWKIELRRGKTNRAYADGPWLAGVMLDAAFSAHLSDANALSQAAE